MRSETSNDFKRVFYFKIMAKNKLQDYFTTAFSYPTKEKDLFKEEIELLQKEGWKVVDKNQLNGISTIYFKREI